MAEVKKAETHIDEQNQVWLDVDNQHFKVGPIWDGEFALSEAAWFERCLKTALDKVVRTNNG